MDFNEQKRQIGELQKHVERLVKMQNDAFKNLPADQYEKIKGYHADANKMLRGMKKGDFSGIESLLEKYTGINKKR